MTVEIYHWLPVLIVVKVILLIACICVRAQRAQRRCVVVERQRRVTVLVPAMSRGPLRRNCEDGVAIVGQAEPMDTSPPPDPPAKRNAHPPSYDQATRGQVQYPLDRHIQTMNPQGPSVHGPRSQSPVAPEPHPQGP